MRSDKQIHLQVSEIYAMSYAVCLVCGLINFMRSYSVDLKKIVVHENNQAVLNLVENDEQNER